MHHHKGDYKISITKLCYKGYYEVSNSLQSWLSLLTYYKMMLSSLQSHLLLTTKFHPQSVIMHYKLSCYSLQSSVVTCYKVLLCLLQSRLFITKSVVTHYKVWLCSLQSRLLLVTKLAVTHYKVGCYSLQTQLLPITKCGYVAQRSSFHQP